MGKLAEQFVQCHADVHELGLVEVEWHDNLRSDGAMAWAMPGAHVVHVTYQLIEEPGMDAASLEFTMAHEVCHLTGWWDEDMATRCGQQAFDTGRCHGL